MTTEFGITLKANGQGEFVSVVNTAEASLNKLGATATTAGSAMSAGSDKGREGIAKVTSDVNALNATLQKVGLAAGAYFGISALAHYSGGIIKIADEYTGLQSRLKLATTSQSEFNLANSALFDIAQRNHTPLSETYALYSKLSPALRELGKTQGQTLQMTELVSKSLLISGAGAAASGAAMLQFAQAMGSGVLRGDEFNSLMENSPRLMQAVADGMNKPLGALRGLAEQGKLSAEEVSNALLSQASKLESEAAKMPLTVSTAMVNMSNAVMVEIAGLDKASGATSNLAGGIKLLTDHAHGLMSALTGMTVAGAAYGGLKLGNVALDAAKGVLANSAALATERAATLASAQAAAAHAAAEMERTAVLARSAAASSVMTGATTASRAATLAHIAATEAHAVALATETAAKTAASASSGIASGALALLGGPIGWITLALGAGAAAWSLWGNSAEKSAQQATEAVARHQKFAADHGLDEKSHLEKELAKAKEDAKSLQMSDIQNASVMGNLFSTTDGDLAAKKRAEIKAIEDKLALDAEKDKNLALRAIDSSAWDKLHQTKKERLDATLKDLEQGYQKQIHQQGITHEQQLAAEKTYQQRRAEIIGKGEPKATHAAAAHADPLQTGIDSIAADNSRAKMAAAGETAKNSASELKLYELAIKGIDAANKLEIEGKHAAAAAMRERTAAAVESARITTDETEKINNNIASKKALDKANEEAAKFIDKLNQSAKDYANSQDLEKQLDGKSIVEKAGLVAQYKAELEIKQELAKFEAMRKDSPAAADAGIAAINAAKPAAVAGAVNAAKAKATDGLVNQVEQAGGGAENDQYAKQIEAQNAYFAAGKQGAEEHARAIEAIEAAHQKNVVARILAGNASKKELANLDAKTTMAITVGSLSSTFAELGKHNKAAFEADKAMKTGNTVMATYSSAVQAYNAMSGIPYVGPALGVAAAAAAISFGMSQVSAIQSASFGGGGGGGGGAPSAPSAPPPQSPSYTPIPGSAPVNSDGSTTPHAAINITVQALHPDAISAATLQQIADGLTPALQQTFGRNGQNVAVLV